MPDDITDEIAEQEDVSPGDPDEAMDSFLEDDEPEKGAEKEEPKATDEPAGDPEPEKAGDDKHEPEKKKDDELVYSDEIDQRIKTIDDEPKPEPEKSVKQEEPPTEPEKKKPEPQTKDSFDNLSEIKLPDKDITVGDLTINLKEYQEDYPEDYAAIMAISNTIANRIVEKHLEPLKKIDDLNNIVNHVVAKQSDAEFWGTITDKHSDAKAVNGSKEFLDWLDKQDAPIQRIAKNMETPEDGIMVLDYYKKSGLKSKADDADKKARAQKKKSDDLHRGTMRSKANVRVTDEVNMDDARAAFNEED